MGKETVSLDRTPREERHETHLMENQNHAITMRETTANRDR